MAAALSYYALFAIPSLLLITLSLLNLFIADEQAKMTIINVAQEIIGSRSAGVISQIIQHLDENANQSDFAQWVGIIILLITATGIVGHLQRSLNRLWDTVPSHHNTFRLHLMQRFFFTAFYHSCRILLLVLFISDAVFSFLHVYLSSSIDISEPVLSTGNHIFSFILMTMIISLIYRYVPNGKMA
ncbi:YihY/virulence factor BrkB family protein [Candidatus Roizmanbacteria bacterium]|nr:MAG: YihY/virulence factor BrkB family protein [Candidatus Roizmanbacteria bacterium]